MAIHLPFLRPAPDAKPGQSPEPASPPSNTPRRDSREDPADFAQVFDHAGDATTAEPKLVLPVPQLARQHGDAGPAGPHGLGRLTGPDRRDGATVSGLPDIAATQDDLPPLPGDHGVPGVAAVDAPSLAHPLTVPADLALPAYTLPGPGPALINAPATTLLAARATALSNPAATLVNSRNPATGADFTLAAAAAPNAAAAGSDPSAALGQSPPSSLVGTTRDISSHGSPDPLAHAARGRASDPPSGWQRATGINPAAPPLTIFNAATPPAGSVVQPAISDPRLAPSPTPTNNAAPPPSATTLTAGMLPSTPAVIGAQTAPGSPLPPDQPQAMPPLSAHDRAVRAAQTAPHTVPLPVDPRHNRQETLPPPVRAGLTQPGDPHSALAKAQFGAAPPVKPRPESIMPDVLPFTTLAGPADQRPLPDLATSVLPRAQAAQIGAQLVQAALAAPGPATEILLNPKELGRVQLSLQAADLTITVAIMVERPETADLMRRHIDSLSQEFRALGYQEVNISIGQRQSGAGQGGPQEHGRNQATAPPETDAASTTIAQLHTGQRHAAPGSLDLRL